MLAWSYATIWVTEKNQNVYSKVSIYHFVYGVRKKKKKKSIITSLVLSCRLHQTTYERLVLLSGGGMSQAMKELLALDPIAPVLAEAHLRAMDRRVIHILAALNACRERKGGWHNVLFWKSHNVYVCGMMHTDCEIPINLYYHIFHEYMYYQAYIHMPVCYFYLTFTLLW